jgi:hypothetical protein
VTKFWVKDAKAYTLNPNGFALSLSKEMIAKVQKRFPANVK